MRDIIKAVCAATIISLPVAAAAQGPNAFDGTYRGVSISVAKYSAYNPYRQGRCPPPARPRPPMLNIANGTARAGAFEGTVTPEGVLRLKTEQAFVVEGRIDAQGNVQAQGSGAHCVWSYVWQKSG